MISTLVNFGVGEGHASNPLAHDPELFAKERRITYIYHLYKSKLGLSIVYRHSRLRNIQFQRF